MDRFSGNQRPIHVNASANFASKLTRVDQTDGLNEALLETKTLRTEIRGLDALDASAMVDIRRVPENQPNDTKYDNDKPIVVSPSGLSSAERSHHSVLPD